MDTVQLSSRTAVEVRQSFYFVIKSYLIQLINFINFVFLKLIRGTPDELGDKVIPKIDSSLLMNGKDVKDVRKLKGVKDMPGPRVLPFVGTLLTSPALASKDLLKSNEERMQKYGSMVKEELYWNFPMINILDADDIDTAVNKLGTLRTGMEIITTYRSLRPDRYDSFGLVNSNGDVWERLHKAAVPVLSSPKYVQSMTLESDRMATDFISLLDKAGPVVHNFQEHFKKFAAETALYNVFGKRMGMLEEEDSMSELKLIFEVHDEYWGAFHASVYGYPWWKYFSTNVWKRFVKAEDSMFDLVKKTMLQIVADDEVDGVFSAIWKSPTLTENDKVVVCLEFITGGSEPVISTAVMLLHHLSRDKEIADKIYEELKQALPSKNSEITEQVLERLPYLKACIMETHRMCPTTPMLGKISEEPIQIGEYEIPAYSLIVLHNLYATLQDKSFYRAKEFLPERWIYKNGVPPFTPHRRNTIMNFGVGTRACPGRRAATLHLTILMARLFRKYEIRFEGEFELEFTWLLNPKFPANIGFYERFHDDD